MKVLFITHYAHLYGANRSMLNLIEGLGELGVQSKVLCREDGDLVEILKKRKIPNFIKKFDSWCYYSSLDIIKLPFKLIRRLFLFPSLFLAVKKYNPDIIYSNSSVIGIGIVLAKCLGKKHFWHIREFGKEDYGLSFEVGQVGLKYFLNSSDGVVFISNSIEKKFSPLKTKSRIIYNGVMGLNEIVTDPKSVLGKKIISFGIVGLLRPEKGQLEAIRATAIFLKQNPEAELLIVGDGDNDYKDLLFEEVENLKIARQVKFLGYLTDLNSVYKNIDVLLMCSQNEGMGRVTVEAMCNGIPVIGYNGGATPEIIQEGKNGYLFQGGPKELSEKMVEISQNKSQYFKLSENAIETAKRFTVERYSKEVFDFLNEVNTEK